MLVIRSIAAMLILSPFMLAAPARLCSTRRGRGLQLVRVLLSALESIMFFVAVTHLPLADTVTFYLAAPIYVTALSALFLKRAGRLAALERGRRRLRRRDDRAAARPPPR